MATPTAILADVHLARSTPAAVGVDLARFIAAHRGERIVFDGDLFDLSVDSATPAQRGSDRSRLAAIPTALGAHPAASAAMAEHLDKGGELWFVSGNHDVEVGEPAFRNALLDALGVSRSALDRLRTTPWFFREGNLHIEHGHLYDPDNAPAHPLVVGEPSLGVYFVENFIAPAGAHRYLNANEGTPLELLVASFGWYGARAPHIVYRYFYTALGALLRSGPLYRAHAEEAFGHTLTAAFAREVSVSETELATLRALGATPTLESLAGTFSRLYLDRVFATLAVSSGLVLALGGLGRAARSVAALGALTMGASWAKGRDRYGGAVSNRLAASAEAVATASGAKLVVFGHTHEEAEGARYANTGSFAFPGKAPGRPYLAIEGTPDAPRAVRRYFTAGKC